MADFDKAGARIVWGMTKTENCVQVATPSIRKKVVLQSTCGQSAATRNAHATDAQKQISKNGHKARIKNCAQAATPSIRKKVILQSTCGQSEATRNAHAIDAQKQISKNGQMLRSRKGPVRRSILTYVPNVRKAYPVTAAMAM